MNQESGHEEFSEDHILVCGVVLVAVLLALVHFVLGKQQSSRQIKSASSTTKQPRQADIDNLQVISHVLMDVRAIVSIMWHLL